MLFTAALPCLSMNLLFKRGNALNIPMPDVYLTYFLKNCEFGHTMFYDINDM